MTTIIGRKIMGEKSKREREREREKKRSWLEIYYLVSVCVTFLKFT